MPNSVRGINALSLVLWLTAAAGTVLAGESPPPRKTAESRELRLLISGELGGLWEGKDPLRPRGGLGNPNRGVLGALSWLKADDGDTVSILMGNNLGRAVKSDDQTSTLGFHGRRPEGSAAPKFPAPTGERCRAALAAAGRDVEKLRKARETCYREAGLSFERCEGFFQDPKISHEEALLQCDRDLFIWLIEKNFGAVALGPGDFNDTGCDPELRELRNYPFVAANVFVRGESSCAGDDCALAKPFGIEEQIFPTDPLIVDLPDEGLAALDTVEIVESKRNMPPNPFASRLLRFRREESTIEHVYTLRRDPAVRHNVVYSASDGADEAGGQLRLTWPVPLWPDTRYEVTVRWNDKNKGKVDRAAFATFELFTQARRERRARRASVRTAPGICTLQAHREPILYRDSGSGQGPMAPWVEEGVPVIDLSKMEGLDAPPPLRILAVIDEEYRPLLDELPEDGMRGPTPLLNQLRFMPMAASINYWRAVMEMLFSFDALTALREGLASDHDRLGPHYATFAALRCNEPEDLPWKDEAWKQEKTAWRTLENAVSGGIGEIQYDLRASSLEKTVEYLRETAPLALLAHASRNRVAELTEKFGDLALAIGQPELDAPGPEPEVRTEITFPYRPTQIRSEEFAASLEEIHLTLSSSSPWRVTRVGYTRHPVPGIPLALLQEGPATGADPCCGGELERLTRKAIINDPSIPLSETASQSDRKHLRDWLGLEMRRLAGTETALIEEGVIDPNTLDWLRALRRITPKQDREDGSGPGPLDLGLATVEELSHLPGIDRELARKIKAYRHPVSGEPIRDREQLEYFWTNSGQVADLDGARWSWVRWLVGPPYEAPYIDHDFFVDQFFRRTIFVNYNLWRVVMTEGQLRELEESLPAGFKLQGLDPDSDPPRLHFRELGGDAPVTVALLSNVASEHGPFSVLAQSNLIRRPVLVRGPGHRNPVGLQQMVRSLSHEDHEPADPPADWIAVEKRERDRQGLWTVSVNAPGFEFQDVQTAQAKIMSNDRRTQTLEQRRISLRPELILGYRGARLDWSTTLRTEYETNRLGPNASPNPLNDLWRLRSEWDYYWRERSRVNFPLYTALSFESQWRRPLQVVELDRYDNPLRFSLGKRKEFRSEIGIAPTNLRKNKFFRLGFVLGRDFDVTTSVTVPNPDAPGMPAVGELSSIGDVLEQGRCPDPDPTSNPREPPPPCFDSATVFSGVGLTTEDLLTVGLAFRGQYELEFGSLLDDQKLTLKTALTEGSFFFRLDGSLPEQPRLRFLLTNELTVPIIGNLSLVPGVEWFVFRNMGGPDSKRQTFWSLRPFFRIDYAFDLKPAFMRIAEGLRFRSR